MTVGLNLSMKSKSRCFEGFLNLCKRAYPFPGFLL